jgi:hypothetical protein
MRNRAREPLESHALLLLLLLFSLASSSSSVELPPSFAQVPLRAHASRAEAGGVLLLLEVEASLLLLLLLLLFPGAGLRTRGCA